MPQHGVLAWSSRWDLCCRPVVAIPDMPGYQVCEHLQLTVLACIESLALRLRRCFLLPSIGMEDCCRLSWTPFRRSAMPLTSPDSPPAGKVCCRSWKCIGRAVQSAPTIKHRPSGLLMHVWGKAHFAESVMAIAGSMTVLHPNCTGHYSLADVSRQATLPSSIDISDGV